MCTIMTFTQQFYQENRDAIHKRMAADESGNPHGVAILMHLGPNNAVKMEMNRLSPCLLDTVPFQRVWIHFRYGTTETKGLNGCHNFDAGNGWFVQHNGIVSCGEGLPVDSIAIGNLCKVIGATDTLHTLITTGESYANTFLVHPESGNYVVGRNQSGSLHTDNLGNYSSHSLASINIPVAINSVTPYITNPPVSKGSREMDTYHYTYEEDRINTLYDYVDGYVDLGYKEYKDLPEDDQTFLKKEFTKDELKQFKNLLKSFAAQDVACTAS